MRFFAFIEFIVELGARQRRAVLSYLVKIKPLSCKENAMIQQSSKFERDLTGFLGEIIKKKAPKLI